MKPINPYQYKGALRPGQNDAVIIPRRKEIQKIIQSIQKNEYLALIGARQVGKTTLLRQIQDKYPHAHYLYIDFETSHQESGKFFRYLINEFYKKIPSHPSSKAVDNLNDYGPEMGFCNFLETFTPEEENKKIILLFDEIGKLPFAGNFLHIWRKVYHERYDKKQLMRYSVVLAGSVSLIPLTKGASSPFNIAEIFPVGDFNESETLKLIQTPMEALGIQIHDNVKDNVWFCTSGHPQLLQHLCYILVESVIETGKTITEEHLEKAINTLLIENINIDILKEQLKFNKPLEDVLMRILDGEKIPYLPYKEFSTTGAGPINANGAHCKIRNEIYFRVIDGTGKGKKNISASRKEFKKLRDEIQADIRVLKDYEEKMIYEANSALMKKIKVELEKFALKENEYRIRYCKLKIQSEIDQEYLALDAGLDSISEKLNRKILEVSHILQQKSILSYFSDIGELTAIEGMLKHLPKEKLIDIEQIAIAVMAGKIDEGLILNCLYNVISKINLEKISNNTTDKYKLEAFTFFSKNTFSIKDIDLKFLVHLPLIATLIANQEEFADTPHHAPGFANCVRELALLWETLCAGLNKNIISNKTVEKDFFNRYADIKKHDSGGMGVVFKANDPALERPVAIKILSRKEIANKIAIDKLIEEARMIAKLDDPNIVKIHDVGEMELGFFISMEFLEGVNLTQLIKKEHPIAIRDILVIARNVFSALVHSHQKKVIHLDIKPGNIMITNDNKVKVIDFGIAALREDLAKNGQPVVMGSPSYMSPEQINGKPTDHCSDIYSAGVTLFELIAGRVPFEGINRAEVLKRQCTAPAPSLKKFRGDVPDELLKIVETCMKKNPSHRYQNARMVLKDLDAVGSGSGNQLISWNTKLKVFPGDDDSSVQIIDDPKTTEASNKKKGVIPE